MKKKPLIFIFLVLLIFPFSLLNSVSSRTSNDDSFVSPSLLELSEGFNENLKILQADNHLYDRWKEPLSPFKVKKFLLEYGEKSLISFFNFKEREIFKKHVTQKDVLIDKIYNTIPALILKYSSNSLKQIDFSLFRIKYVYPIGKYSFTVPQNIDVDLSGRVELSQIRRALQIDELHDKGLTGYGATVAVLDSGLNVTEAPSLSTLRNYDEPKVISNINFNGEGEDNNDLSGHGTHIASVLAGNGNFSEDSTVENTTNYGIAPDARLINVKVLDKTGYGEDEWLINGFDYAIEPLYSPFPTDIISASLTSLTFAAMGDPVEELMYEAGRRGILVVASAGNYGPTGCSTGAPALWDYVISAGATHNMKELALYTSRGLNQNFSTGIDIVAPGNSVGGSSATTGEVSYRSGTSISAPIVSGVLALLIQAFPDLKASKYEAALFTTADDLNLPVVAQGNGLIDPLEAYNYLVMNQNKSLFSVNPRRISPENLYYYECVEGKSTEFKVKLVSSENQSIATYVEGDTEFIDIQPIINVYEGWNHFSFNISIPMDTDIQNINAKIIFLNTEDIQNEIEINIQTRFYGGTVLFDISHDNDTANIWFDASTPYASHLFLSRRLKDRGYYVEYHTGGNYSLTDVHILVISDPELNYTAGELSAISDYVQTGGSLLFLVNGMRLIDSGDIEEEPLISSNYYACDQVLGLFEAKVFETAPFEYVPREVEVIDQSGIINTESFFYWGWPVAFDLESTNPNNKILARIPDPYITNNEEEIYFNVTLSTEIGEGRVMIFGSGYPFTDIGLQPDTFEINPGRAGLSSKFGNLFLLDSKNSQLVNDTFDWLIKENRPIFNIDIDPDKAYIRQSLTLQINITKDDGAPYFTPLKLNATIIHPDHSFEQFELETQYYETGQYYEAVITLSSYGWHTIYVPLKLSNHTPTDGRIDVFCGVVLWDHIPLIKNISIGVIVFIIIAIILTPAARSRFRKEAPKIE